MTFRGNSTMPITDFDYRSYWELVSAYGLTALAILFLSLITTVIVADKSPTYYYIGDSQNVRTCAYANQNWTTDELAYCSENPGLALQFVIEANKTLPKRFEGRFGSGVFQKEF